MGSTPHVRAEDALGPAKILHRASNSVVLRTPQRIEFHAEDELPPGYLLLGSLALLFIASFSGPFLAGFPLALGCAFSGIIGILRDGTVLAELDTGLIRKFRGGRPLGVWTTDEVESISVTRAFVHRPLSWSLRLRLRTGHVLHLAYGRREDLESLAQRCGPGASAPSNAA